MRLSSQNRVRWAVRRVFYMLALAFALAPLGFGRVWHAHGQADVVTLEDVTTPTSLPVLLPTPTALPAAKNQAGGANDDEAWEPSGQGATSTGYVVQEGDTLWTVALEIGLDLDVTPCLVDPFYRPDAPLVIGERLEPPVWELLCHEVQPGETLSSIATLYQVDPARIVSDPWNRLAGSGEGNMPLESGRYVRIVIGQSAPPSQGFLTYLLDRPIDEPPWVAYGIGGPTRKRGQTLVPEDWPYGSGYFEWPTYGWITQGYRNDHRALDIAAPPGAFVTAADRGVVVRAGWNNQGYGMFVVVDHNIDYVTLYSHLQDIFVQEGDIVAQGQVIGAVGSTGNSTGPHLHFEVRDFGSRINPLEVLLR